MSDSTPRLPLLRATTAILIAVALNIILSIGVDSILDWLGVLPPFGQPLLETGDNLLALSYRLVITVLANVAGLRFAGFALGRIAVALGIIGTALGLAGVVVATSGPVDLGPDWYPWSLAASAIPCAWLAWVIARRGRAAN